MSENKYMTESILSIRNLMGRMGENLIMEGVAPLAEDSFVSCAKPMDLQNDIDVIINTGYGKNNTQNANVYINYDLTEIVRTFSRDEAISIISQLMSYIKNDLKNNRCGRYNKSNNDLKLSSLPESGDYHLSHILRNTSEEQIQRAHSVYYTIYTFCKGKINMTWNDVLSQIGISSRLNLINTTSSKGLSILGGFLSKAGERWRKAKEAIKGMFGKKPVITDDEGKQVAIALDPRVRFGHQLSGLNQAMVIEQAKEYGIPTPQFVCKAEMITGKRPWGFERKFKNGITIHPYYIRFVNHRKANLATLMKIFTNPEDQAMIKENPQIANELSIANGDHGAGINLNPTIFGWSVYYDIAETEPVNPEEDVFTETIGSSNNLQHVANEMTKALQNELNKKEGKALIDDYNDSVDTSETSADTEMPANNNVANNIPTSEIETQESDKASQLDANIELIQSVANDMGFPEAYQNVGHKNATDCDTLYWRLEVIVRNLCNLIIAQKITARNIQQCLPFTPLAAQMVLDELGVEHKVEHSSQPNKDSIETAEKIISYIRQYKKEQKKPKHVGMFGESILGQCLASALNG